MWEDLPTEIWREVVTRRQRYEELRKKLADGEVRTINDFVTLNLDLRQFAQDVIQNCEGPDFLMAFWQAIITITILYPTGGSGAFIFTALNILALVQKPLSECANSVLLPLAGAIIGLSFAWAGNAQALLQTSEIEDVADKAPGGLVEYAYVYQTAILLILIALVGWTIAGLSVFDSFWPAPARTRCYFAARASLFGLSSLALRERWHVVLGAQWMLLIRREIKRSKGDQEKRKQ